MTKAKEGESARFEQGLAIRREVLGAEYVDGSLAKADDFMMTFQRITTEWCWGYAWSRDGLDRKTRSMLNLAMLTALNRPHEIKIHVRGALTNGVTEEEIVEVILQAAIYCGVPAAIDTMRVASEVIRQVRAEKAADAG